MLTDTPDVYAIRRLLENTELKIVLDSPENNYRIEYFTTSVKDRGTGESHRTRTYRLLDLIRGGVTPEPWDTFDVDKQVTLVANLMRVSRYRITKVICGWEATCPVCGHNMRGKIWDSVPKSCPAQNPRKCRTTIGDESISEVLFADAAAVPVAERLA